jgi:hypothetical protein
MVIREARVSRESKVGKVPEREIDGKRSLLLFIIIGSTGIQQTILPVLIISMPGFVSP